MTTKHKIEKRIKHSFTPAPPPTHTHTPVCEIINYQTFVHPPPPTHTPVCEIINYQTFVHPPPPTHTPVCEIINYQTFVHPPPPPTGVRGGGGERGDRMFEQLGDSRSVWGWGMCWRNVGG